MAAGQGLEALFRPRSIVVVGASQDPTKIGGRPIQLLQKCGFAGSIYPVNPRAAEVQGLKAYASVAALSRFAAAHTDSVAEIDINPLLLMPKGQGAVALDALLIPRAHVKERS